MRTHYNHFAGGDVGRIAALSDGIFAFAATMLMLDFHSPEPADIHSEAEFLSALISSSHRLMPWLLSLLTLGIFWLAQQTQLSQLARSNRDLTWLHLMFLAIVTVLAILDPSPRRLSSPTAPLSLSTGPTSSCSAWPSTPLGLMPSERSSFARTRRQSFLTPSRRVIIAQSLYAMGALLGLVNVTLGITLIILIQLNYAIAPRLPIFRAFDVQFNSSVIPGGPKVGPGIQRRRKASIPDRPLCGRRE